MSDSALISPPETPAAVTDFRSASSLLMADRFFADAIRSNALAHAYLLKGNNMDAIYQLILQIAAVANCKNPPERLNAQSISALFCGTCVDCRWSAQNAHPGILTISRLTYQVDDAGRDLNPDALEKLTKKTAQPTQIKAAQIERLIEQLALSTDHTRVVIFSDVETLPAALPSRTIAPYEWRSLDINADKSFHIRPLQRHLFNHASGNRFLKTLEEPASRTLFFFIAETEEQVMETIVSRCQVLLCAELSTRIQTLSSAETATNAILQQWLPSLSPTSDPYDMLGTFSEAFLKTMELSSIQAIGLLQAGLRYRYLPAIGANKELFLPYRKLQLEISAIESLLDAKVNESQTLVELMLTLKQRIPTLEALFHN